MAIDSSAAQAVNQQKFYYLTRPFHLLWRYKVFIIFPSFAAWTIWADYTHTQKWKAAKKAKAEAEAAATARAQTNVN